MVNGLLQGLIGGYGQTGGLDKLSQWAAMKINPQGYNPFNDPLFLKEMQTASQMGGAAKTDFVNKYDDYMRFQIPQGETGPVRMSPDQKWQQMTGLGWENPQQQIHMAQMALEQAKARNELSQAGYWDQYAGLRGAEANQTNALIPHLINTEKAQANQYDSRANLYQQQTLTEAALRDPRVYSEIMLGDLRAAEGSVATNRADLYGEQALTEAALRDPRVYAENALGDQRTAERIAATSRANLYGEQALSEQALRDPRVNSELARSALLNAQSKTENVILPLLLDKYSSEINATNALADQRKGLYSNSQNQFDQYVQYHINGGNPGTDDFELFVPPKDSEGYIVNPFSGEKWVNPATNQPYLDDSDSGFNLWKWALPVNNTGWFSQDSRTTSQGDSGSESAGGRGKPESVNETIKQLITRTGVRDANELLRYLNNADPEVIQVIEETSGQKIKSIIHNLQLASRYVNITPDFYK